MENHRGKYIIVSNGKQQKPHKRNTYELCFPQPSVYTRGIGASVQIVYWGKQVDLFLMLPNNERYASCIDAVWTVSDLS